MSEEKRTTEDLSELAKQLFGGMGEGNSEEMISKYAQEMLDEFNSMLTQVVFNMLLGMVPEEKQQQLREEVYNAWSNRMQEQLKDVSTDDDSGISKLFGVDNIMDKSFEMAEGHIKSYLGLN